MSDVVSKICDLPVFNARCEHKALTEIGLTYNGSRHIVDKTRCFKRKTVKKKVLSFLYKKLEETDETKSRIMEILEELNE